MELEGDRDGAGDRQRQERKEGRSYHDISPLLCCYILEQCSASLMLGVAQCSWSGSSRGVWGIRVLEVEFLYNGWGVDLCVGEPHVIRVRPPNKLNELP